MTKKPQYKRVVLKISGEALQGSLKHGIDFNFCEKLALEIKEVCTLGIQIALVVGAGNIFRGAENTRRLGMDRSVADYMGMMATVINGMALQDILEKVGVPTRVQTSIQMHEIAEPYIRRKAIRHLEKKRVVIFVAGTGNPYFTTDTAAALKAMEINADIILKATKVDGVYSADPLKVKNARKYKTLKYIDVLKRGLKVMDATAISLCMDNKLPILVFNLNKHGNIKKALLAKDIGTVVK